MVQGYRHQKVGKIITKTVIVEKVEKKKRCIGRICMKNEKEEKKKDVGGYSTERSSKETWERIVSEDTISVKTVFLFVLAPAARLGCGSSRSKFGRRISSR